LVTGNLPTDGTALNLFVDVNPGTTAGQNRLVTAHLPAPPAGLAPLDGTTFDAGFAPDVLLAVNSVGGLLYVDAVSLPTAPTLAAKTYRGASAVNGGRGVLSGGANPNGLEVALDNTNTLGSIAATTGFEFRIPFAELGLSAGFRGRLSLAAGLERTNGVHANQWMPSLAAGSVELGLSPILAKVAGTQHVTFAVGLVGDINADGLVSGGDLSALLASWGQTAAASGFLAADLDGDGAVGGPDLAALLAAWGNGV
jgi:hypothetical protein